jgi:hypothetical protein
MKGKRLGNKERSDRKNVRSTIAEERKTNVKRKGTRKIERKMKMKSRTCVKRKNGREIRRKKERTSLFSEIPPGIKKNPEQSKNTFSQPPHPSTSSRRTFILYHQHNLEKG